MGCQQDPSPDAYPAGGRGQCSARLAKAAIKRAVFTSRVPAADFLFVASVIRGEENTLSEAPFEPPSPAARGSMRVGVDMFMLDNCRREMLEDEALSSGDWKFQTT